jgi:hypothetical protein
MRGIAFDGRGGMMILIVVTGEPGLKEAGI